MIKEIPELISNFFGNRPYRRMMRERIREYETHLAVIETMREYEKHQQVMKDGDRIILFRDIEIFLGGMR